MPLHPEGIFIVTVDRCEWFAGRTAPALRIHTKSKLIVFLGPREYRLLWCKDADKPLYGPPPPIDPSWLEDRQIEVIIKHREFWSEGQRYFTAQPRVRKIIPREDFSSRIRLTGGF